MKILFAKLKAKPGMEAALEERLRAVVPHIRGEKGNLYYSFNQAEDDPGTFLYFERYIDQESVDFHLNAPYADASDLCAEPPWLQVCDELALVKNYSNI